MTEGSEGSGLPSATSDEQTRLRAEVAALRRELDARTADTMALPSGAQERVREPRTGWWRPLVASLLIALAALAAPASIVAGWAHDQVSDTDRYVQTITPLAHDPAVQDAIVSRVTDTIFTRLDVAALTQEAVSALAAQGLPNRVANGLDALSRPLASGVRSFVAERVRRFVRSPEFVDAWVRANRQAHTQLVAVLSGEGTDQVTVDDGVQINLAAVIAAVTNQLQASGFTLASRIPSVNASFTVVQSADLAKAQKGFRLLRAAARLLPVLRLLLAVAAVYLARDRRRAILGLGLAVAATILLLGAALNVFRPAYLDAIRDAVLPRNAAAVIYDTLVDYIRVNLRALLVVALAVAAGAWLAGSSGAPLAARSAIVRGSSVLRGGAEQVGVRTGPVGAFVFTYRPALRAVVVGAAMIVYVAAAHPTGAWTLRVVAITAGVLLVLEFLARPPSNASADPGAALGAGPGGTT